MEWPKFFIDADHAVACADPISPHTMLARRNIAVLRRGGGIICGGAIEGDRPHRSRTNALMHYLYIRM